MWFTYDFKRITSTLVAWLTLSHYFESCCVLWVYNKQQRISYNTILPVPTLGSIIEIDYCCNGFIFTFENPLQKKLQSVHKFCHTKCEVLHPATFRYIQTLKYNYVNRSCKNFNVNSKLQNSPLSSNHNLELSMFKLSYLNYFDLI